MTTDTEVTSLGSGIQLCAVQTDRFKTCRISVALTLPLREETTAANAILPYLLHRSCREFPHPNLLNRRLAELYGARLSADVSKLGENQMLRIQISAIDDRFALSGEKVAQQCAELLASLFFDPALEGGFFSQTDIDREKRLLIETLEGEKNDKRLYALKRCEALMCQNEAYGLDRLGTREAIEALTPQSVTEAYHNMLKTAKIQINMIGSADPAHAVEGMRSGFAGIARENIADCKTKVITRADEVRTFEERLPINQGKLVLGLRAGTAEPDEDVIETRVMTDVFGGGPYSRLFANVREKLSLCYYCSARYNASKGVIFVQSGIEEKNKEKAIEEIQRQLAVVAAGETEAKDFEASKKSLADAYRGVGDTPEGLDAWYTTQMLHARILSPEEYVRRIECITPEQIALAAQKVTLDTIYMLAGEEESHE